jgi:hypothetical protein
MGKLIDVVSDTMGRTDTEMWKKFAEEINGKHEAATALRGEKISTEYKGLDIKYDMVSFRGCSYTRLRIDFKSSKSFNLVLGTKYYINFYFNIIGIKTALNLLKYRKIYLDDKLSNKFVIKGKNEDLIRNIFNDKILRILNNSDIYAFEINSNGVSGKMQSIIFKHMENIEYFSTFHNMVCSIIDNLEDLKVINPHF